MADLLKHILNLDVVWDVDMGVVDIQEIGAIAVKYKPIFQGWVAVFMHHPTVSDPSDMVHTIV